ncbi:MAG TPA: AlkA N-terminal domain-containing protein [Rhizomicrobium sp.]|jgi:AraC family transcriptional regulator of adaptative response / DNA-3-methyladenine glycosylase II|nr:AlkA N-terminal domain-containing protein [Rhizomicrobium sp.]
MGTRILAWVTTMHELPWRVCARARLARDPRFDGKFFIGVRGSGVYCRPICPAPTAKEKNCTYFPTAAAAAEAGYRPCLRCRPESSPGTPAWLGTSTTVSRALRLIDETGPEDGGVEGLAARLGVGARHLRRLFLKHLGATPNAVAQTRRVHFAKKLIDETNLPMTELAIAAGYGCVRRFNDAIRKTYHRTPTQIRALARGTKSLPENHYLFRLRFRPPYDWKGILSFLAASAIPGVEAVDGISYRRTISLKGSDGAFEVSLDPKYPALLARIQFGDPRALFFIVERIRALFDLNADWSPIEKVLALDPLLKPRLKSAPGLRVPGCWNGFELAVQTIVAEGCSDASAVVGRFVQTFGRQFLAGPGLTHLFPDAETLAEAQLQRAGLPPGSCNSVRALARAVRSGEIVFDRATESRGFVASLRKVAGMDEPTAQYVAMRALGEPDAFPVGNKALKARSASWCPWRAYAAMYLWDEARLAANGRPAKRPATGAARA